MTIIRACRNLWIACVAGRCLRRCSSRCWFCLPPAPGSTGSAAGRTTVVVFVRHAEPQPTSGGDPDLSITGERRVAALGGFLADLFVAGKVDHLYAADTRRARQTAAPVANQFGLPINLLASNDWPTLARRIKSEHRGETVVVVYASTLPIVLEQLTDTKVDVGEEEFDSVFVVVLPSPGQPRVLRLHYGASVATATPAAATPAASPERT